MNSKPFKYLEKRMVERLCGVSKEGLKGREGRPCNQKKKQLQLRIVQKMQRRESVESSKEAVKKSKGSNIHPCSFQDIFCIIQTQAKYVLLKYS